MILAPSHQPLLNGNKLVLLLLALTSLLSLSACELFKKLPDDGSKPPTSVELEPIQGRRVYDPKTGTYIIVESAPVEKMDTVKWTDIPASTSPPIFSANVPPPTRPGSGATTGGGTNPVNPIGLGEQGSQLLSSYNVAVVLPFLTDRFSSNNINENSDWALHFYGGVRMALDELSAKGIALNVSVLDSKASDQWTSSLVRTNQDLNNAHLVIGPYRRDNVAIVANHLRNKLTGVLVSPQSAASNISDGNPNYVQVNPTLETHCQVIMQHAYARYQPNQIVLVAREADNEVERLVYFQQEFRRLQMMAGVKDTTRLREVIIRGNNPSNLGGVNLASYLRRDEETVFILPTWSDELYLVAFMRNLDAARSNYQSVTIYGMPQWMNFERVDYEYFEKLKVHVSSSTFLDPLDVAVQQFRQSFFDRFGTIPNEEAFVGYDVTRYFCQLLHQHGTRFQYQLERSTEQLMHTKFEFGRVIAPNISGAMLENAPIERWENRHINILKFENYQFQKDN